MQNLRAEARSSTSPERLRVLALTNRSLAQEALQNPSVSAVLLKELFDTYEDPKTRSAILRHPNCPLDLLTSMGSQHLRALFANPVLPLLLLEDPSFFSKLNKYQLVNNLTDELVPFFFDRWSTDKTDLYLQARLATHRGLSTAQLERLLPSTNQAINLNIASHPNAPAWFLRQVAWGLNYTWRLAVAQNKSAPADLLLELVQYESGVNTRTPLPSKPPNASPLQSASLRKALAQNLSTPAEALALLAKDLLQDVRLLVARHPNTTERALLALVRDEDPTIRLEVLRRATLSPALFAAVSAPSPAELAVIARHPCAPTALLLTLHAGGLLLKELVENPATPPSVLQAVAAHPAVAIRAGVARHASTPPKQLEALSLDTELQVRIGVAQHKSTPPNAVARLCADAAPQVRRLAQRHPNAPRALLQLMYQAGASFELTSVGKARRPLTPDEITRLQGAGPFAASLLSAQPASDSLRSWLWRGFARTLREEDSSIKALWDCAQHALTEPEYAALVSETNAFLRARIATNPRLSAAHLTTLSGDKVWFVRLAVALNGAAPAEALHALSSDRDLRVRRTAAKHPRLPEEDRAVLRYDDKAKVRRAANAWLSLPAITRRRSPQR